MEIWIVLHESFIILKLNRLWLPLESIFIYAIPKPRLFYRKGEQMHTYNENAISYADRVGEGWQKIEIFCERGLNWSTYSI